MVKMDRIEFQRLISRSVVNLLERELKLAGVKMDINKFLKICVLGGTRPVTPSPRSRRGRSTNCFRRRIEYAMARRWVS